MSALRYSYLSMDKKPPPEGNPKDKLRTEQAQKVAEEYAKGLREFIKKLRKLLN